MFWPGSIWELQLTCTSSIWLLQIFWCALVSWILKLIHFNFSYVCPSNVYSWSTMSIKGSIDFKFCRMSNSIPFSQLFFQRLIHDKYLFIVSVPLTPLSTFMDKWIFGEVLCKVTGASQVRTDFAKACFL